MSLERVKKRSFNISIFNIKISPKKSSEDYTNMYRELIKKLHTDNIAINTRGEKFLEMRTQFSHDSGRVLYGMLTYYTILDGDAWYNKRSKTIESVELDNDLFPNAKEVEYYFIPELHRFCFITKSNGIAMSQIEIFLKKALPEIVGPGKEVFVTKELTKDAIERIIKAPSVSRLEIGISYSNNDLTEDFEKLFDDDLRDGQVKSLDMTARSFQAESIDVENSKVLSAALKLSQSNGYAEATIKNESGRNENVATNDYPRKELVTSTVGNEPRDVLSKVLRLFRNGRR